MLLCSLANNVGFEAEEGPHEAVGHAAVAEADETAEVDGNNSGEADAYSAGAPPYLLMSNNHLRPPRPLNCLELAL